MMNLFGSCRKLLFRSAVNDMYLSSKPEGSTCRIHGNISAAYYSNLLAYLYGCCIVIKISLHEIASCKILICGKYSHGSFSRDSHEHGKSCTGAYKYRLKAFILHKLIYGYGFSDNYICLYLYSKRLHIFYFD